MLIYCPYICFFFTADANSAFGKLLCPDCVPNVSLQDPAASHSSGKKIQSLSVNRREWDSSILLLTDSKVASCRVWATWRLWSSCCQCSYRNTWGSKRRAIYIRGPCVNATTPGSLEHTCGGFINGPTKQTFVHIKVLSRKGTEQLVQWSSITEKVILWYCDCVVYYWVSEGQ